MLKTRQQQAAKTIETARLENLLIFQLNGEPILSINTLPTSIQLSQRSFIALSHQPNKHKRETSGQPSSDVILLANRFRDCIAVLAKVLRARHKTPTPAT